MLQPLEDFAPGVGKITEVASGSLNSLLEICECYRLSGPPLTRIRSLVEKRDHTLLLNALSPIAPGMAYGHHGDCCLEARSLLYQDEHWRSLAVRIGKAYERYCDSSGNQLLWSGWNYWDPRKSPKDQRRFQVVVSPSSELSRFITLPTTLLTLSDSPLNTRYFLDLPPVIPNFNPGGDKDFESVRRYAEALWHYLFRPSAELFSQPGNCTIVDYLRHEMLFEDFTGSQTSELGKAFAAYFHDSEIPSTAVGFACLPEWSQALWSTVTEIANSIAGGPVERLLAAWQKFADRAQRQPETLPGELRQALDALSDSLRISSSNARQAYVIFQHLALFDRFLSSPIQYVFPVSFGKHVFVAFMAMKKVLPFEEQVLWHQIVSNLFGGLLVEHLTEIKIRHEDSDRQRLMLSHSLPKAILKPIEYFSWRLQAHANRRNVPAEIVNGSARAIRLLVGRAQAMLSDYVNWDGAGDLPESTHLRGSTDMVALMNELTMIFHEVKELMVTGYVDRMVRREGARRTLREELLADKSGSLLRLSVDTGAELLEVPGNRGLWAVHLWNMIENAFRYMTFERFLAARHLDEPLLEISFSFVISDDKLVTMKVANNGKPIFDRRLDLLNAVLGNKKQSGEYQRAVQILATSGDEGLAGEGMERESSGQSLARFSDFLRDLWRQVGEPHDVVGRVDSNPQGPLFTYYIPVPGSYRA